MWPFHYWRLWAFHFSNTSSAETASSTPIPVKKSRNSVKCGFRLVFFFLLYWYQPQLGLTKGFKNSCLFSVSRFCLIYNFPKLCKHLGLWKQCDLPSKLLTQNIYSHLGYTFTEYSNKLTPERMTSPDSAMAPSLLSTYTTASFINTSSSSRQSGLHAPTATQQQEQNEKLAF